MKKRVLLGIGIVVLVLSVLVLVAQGSFNLGKFNPSDPQQALIFWAVTILIFVLMVTLGFILFRELVKLYFARQASQEGSRIRTKLVLGALALSCVPVFFLVSFSFEILSLSMNRWFTNPIRQQVDVFVDTARLLEREVQEQLNAQAALLAAHLEARQLQTGRFPDRALVEEFARSRNIETAAIRLPGKDQAPVEWRREGAAHGKERKDIGASAPVRSGGTVAGYVDLTAHLPLDVNERLNTIRKYDTQWIELKDGLRAAKYIYTMLMVLITLFVLFFTTWSAFFLAKQISVPIVALLDGASEVRKGNLRHRVNVRATDELRSLVRAFNQMTEALDSSSQELDRRRRFTEAILESIPTGVISIGPDGAVQRVNQALSKILPADVVARATRLEDLFSREDTAEIKYMMKRARRTGSANRQMELRTESRKLQLAVTVSALEEKLTSGFVVVLEDTSELLRAQKAAAWREVARRVAHELKNPLTPIALSAERMGRQLDRMNLPPATTRILHECVETIVKSVDSVKTLVDEFSQFARFPTAQPVRSDLNQVVEDALLVFKDRLEGISIQTSFAPDLPPANLDREQFGRVVVNLVDNAAEAMQDALVKELHITTQPGAAETLELVIADSGCGVSPDDKEKLFLPYFSTKNRGTGLGLAIVSHIVAEHNGQIRVEDNQPVGARFTVEIPAFGDGEGAEAGARPAVVRA